MVRGAEPTPSKYPDTVSDRSKSTASNAVCQPAVKPVVPDNIKMFAVTAFGGATPVAVLLTQPAAVVNVPCPPLFISDMYVPVAEYHWTPM